MENQEEFKYKRRTKKVPQDVRVKISQSLRNRGKSETTKERISNGMKEYWGNKANFPDDM